MWFRLLNKKDEKGHGILYHYIKNEDLLYLQEHLEQTPEGKTYLKLEEAIKKTDYDSCYAILEALSVDADMLSGILSFTDKLQRTVLMQAVSALYEVVDTWNSAHENQNEPNRKQRLMNALDLEDFRVRLVKIDGIHAFSIEKEFEKRKAIVQLLLTYCKKLDSNTWKYIVSVRDIVCDNVLTKATQTGDVNLVKEIFDMIPEGGERVDMAVHSRGANVFYASVKACNRWMVKFWYKQLSRLLKEATSIKQLDRIEKTMDYALERSEKIGAYYVNTLTSEYTPPIEQRKKELLKQEEEVRQKAIEQVSNENIEENEEITKIREKENQSSGNESKNPLSGCAIM